MKRCISPLSVRCCGLTSTDRYRSLTCCFFGRLYFRRFSPVKQRYNAPVHRAKSGRAFRQSKPRKSRPKDAHNRFKTIRRDSFVPQDESASKRLTRVFWLKWVRASARYYCRRFAARQAKGDALPFWRNDMLSANLVS